jgi:translation initiation factor IF-3
MMGVIPVREAMALATQQNLDLVEVAPNADPPVCRVMDFGKYRYNLSVKEKDAKKHQQSRALKEVKFHANVEPHDLQIKINHTQRFLEKGHKVKLSLMFRGRENAHRELGFDLIKRVLKDCETVCIVDMAPKMMGRSIIAMIGPRAKKEMVGKSTSTETEPRPPVSPPRSQPPAPSSPSAIPAPVAPAPDAAKPVDTTTAIC